MDVYQKRNGSMWWLPLKCSYWWGFATKEQFSEQVGLDRSIRDVYFITDAVWTSYRGSLHLFNPGDHAAMSGGTSKMLMVWCVVHFKYLNLELICHHIWVSCVVLDDYGSKKTLAIMESRLMWTCSWSEELTNIRIEVSWINCDIIWNNMTKMNADIYSRHGGGHRWLRFLEYLLYGHILHDQIHMSLGSEEG